MSEERYQFFKFTCKDAMCRAEMAINSSENIIECFECGQKFDRLDLEDAEFLPVPTEWASQKVLRRLVFTNVLPKRGPEFVKVNGLSNYYCKLLSPLLTKYGMDKATGCAKLLTEMNQGEIFDCSLFRDRAFLIEAKHLSITGFGRDVTGSVNYLSETLKIITSSNDGEERLVPIYTDGDGHCLVHAISRALVGRELFWHPLRCCLKKHFENNLDKYQQLFKDFMQPEDWQAIIDESDPDFKPPEGELHGLRNMHIFGLANVLKRPIILLDSLECMKKCGDYSALFLPGFILPEDCRGKDNTLNKPICIAWSSFSHNHYIPLVGVQKRPLPVLPQALIPKVWGMPQNQVEHYIESDSNGNYIIGGGRVLTENYIQRLVKAMETLFLEKKGVHPMLVADARLYLFSETAFLSVKAETVIENTRILVEEGRLFQCLSCKALCQICLDMSLFRPGGLVYNAILQSNKKLNPETTYKVATNGLACKYDSLKNEFIPDVSAIHLKNCTFCHRYQELFATLLPERLSLNVSYNASMRRIRRDNTLIYVDGDEEYNGNCSLTLTQENRTLAENNEDPEEKENSDRLTLRIKWNGVAAQHSLSWQEFKELGGDFIHDSVSCLASNFVDKYFPHESSNPYFLLHVCDEIWNQISKQVSVDKLKSTEPVVEKDMDFEEKTKKKESSSQPINISGPQIVKIVSSSGQPKNLTLSRDGLSYRQLQEWIATEFKIPPQNQLIKWGFPPKEFEVPSDINKKSLPLQHGDRLMVENNIHNVSQKKNYLNTAPQTRSSDYLDFTEVLTQNHEFLWRCSILKPELFKKGGTFFNCASEKHILCDMLHVNVPLFPTKRFCYNASSGSLELCVKSLGHFQVTPDIDSRIEAARRGEIVAGFNRCPQMAGPSRETVVSRPYRKPITPSPEDGRPLVRKGPGFSVLSPPTEEMDFS